VANGGIRTEADSRVMMNLDAMEPSLVLMRRDGSLISKEQLPQRMNSVRHLAVAADGTIVSGQQYEGDPQDSVPLLAIKRPGQAFQPFPLGEAQRAAMNQYTASLAIHDELRLLALTAPRGNRFFIWNLDSTELLLDAPLPDCAGVGAVVNGFVVTSGQGRCRLYDCRGEQIAVRPLELPAGLWDNHCAWPDAEKVPAEGSRPATQCRPILKSTAPGAVTGLSSPTDRDIRNAAAHSGGGGLLPATRSPPCFCKNPCAHRFSRCSAAAWR